MFKRIQRLDDKVVDNIIKFRSPVKNKIMIAASSAGNLGVIWFAICLPFLIYAPTRMTGVNIIFSLALTELICELMLKHIVKRERPSNYLADEEQLIHRPKYYSFPSGHTAASFCVVGTTLLRCPFYIVIPIFIIAVMISLSRVYLRVHYLSDVAVGAILGFICGCAAVGIFNQVVQSFI